MTEVRPFSKRHVTIFRLAEPFYKIKPRKKNGRDRRGGEKYTRYLKKKACFREGGIKSEPAGKPRFRNADLIYRADSSGEQKRGGKKIKTNGEKPKTSEKTVKKN